MKFTGKWLYIYGILLVFASTMMLAQEIVATVTPLHYTNSPVHRQNADRVKNKKLLLLQEIPDISLSYKVGSLQPLQVVPGQPVAFSVVIRNAGSKDLLVDPLNSILKFTDQQHTFEAPVQGNITIPGTPEDTAARETRVTFTVNTVPANIASGEYPFEIIFRGTLGEGQIFSGETLNSGSDRITVLSEAALAIDSIRILSNAVTVGQRGVRVQYFLRNTGQSAANVSRLSSVFKNSSGGDLSDQWIVVDEDEIPFSIAAADTRLFVRDFWVLSSHPSGKVTAFLEGQYNDVLKPNTAVVLRDPTVFDEVTAMVPAVLEFTGQIAAPAGAVDGTISTAQKLIWRFNLNQVPGTADLKSGDNTVIRLSSDRFFFEETLTRHTRDVIIFPDSTFDITVWAPVNESGISQMEATVIDTSRDVNSNTPAMVIPSNKVTQMLQLQQRAALITELSGVSLADKIVPFRVTATVRNQGEAGIVPSRVRMKLDLTRASGLKLLDGNLLNTVPLQNGVGSVDFLFQGLGASENTINVSILEDAALDSNSTLPAYKKIGRDSLRVKVLENALNNMAVAIQGPEGALDKVVSTGQTFNINANYQFGPNVDSQHRKAWLEIPTGYAANTDIVVLPSNEGTGRVAWNVRAPVNASGSLDSLVVFIAGQTVPEAVPIRLRSAIGLRIETQAELSIQANIIEPAGAVDGVLSTQQRFELGISVENEGAAQTVGDNRIRVSLPSGYTFWGTANRDSSFSLPSETNISIPVKAPDLPSSAQDTIRVVLTEAAADQNSGDKARVVNQDEAVLVKTVLQSHLQIVIRADSLLSVNQSNIPIQVSVSNVGEARVIPEKVKVRLELGTLLAFTGNQSDTAIVELSNEQSGQHTFLASSFGSTGKTFLKAQIVDTAIRDENSNTLPYTAPEEYPFNVRLMPRATIQVTEFLITAPVGARDDIVSTAQRFKLRARVVFDGSVAEDGRFVELSLPESFLVDNTIKPLNGDSAIWEVIAPVESKLLSGLVKAEKKSDSLRSGSIRSESYPFQVIAKGKDGNSGEAIQSLPVSRNIVVAPRANLVLSGKIIKGAFNNMVSFGSVFEYQATVSNIGEADVLENPPGNITLELGKKLTLAEGSFQKSFQVNQPVVWKIKADESAVSSQIFQEIKRLSVQKSPDAAIKREKLYQRLAAVSEISFVRTRITGAPLDENSGETAVLAKGSEEWVINLIERPSIKILPEAVNLPEVVSTDQIVQVEIEVAAPEHVIERSGRLRLPAGFSFLNPADSIKVFTGAQVRWNIRAPRSIDSKRLTAKLQFQVSGKDQNNSDTIVKDSLQVDINVVQKARLTLVSPAAELRLSQGEAFEINMIVQNLGEAGVEGTGSLLLALQNNNFRLQPGETFAKEFTLDSESQSASINWKLIAPNIDINTVLEVRFVALPLDLNSKEAVALEKTNQTIDLNMVTGQLLASKLLNIKLENSYIRGEKNIPVIGLALHNPSSNDRIRIQHFAIAVEENNAAVSDIHNLLDRVEVLSYNSFVSQNKKNSRELLGEISVVDTTANPLLIPFKVEHILPPQSRDTMVVRIDLASESLNRNFRLRIHNISAEGSLTGRIAIVDTLGTPIQLSPEFQTSLVTILSNERKKVFRNYPNPFGMNTQFPDLPQGTTRFSVLMKENGSGELRIYTLLGKLVWKSPQTALNEGLNNGALTWDGRNSEGQRVVNGVYVAVLNVKYNSGASEIFKTKVVYIK